MQLPNLSDGMRNKIPIQHMRFGAHFFGGGAKDKGEIPPPIGKQCTINWPEKWKSFSTSIGRWIPNEWEIHGEFP
jgi:hypothetical protein